MGHACSLLCLYSYSHLSNLKVEVRWIDATTAINCLYCLLLHLSIMSTERESLFEPHSPQAGRLDTPSPPLVEIGGLLAGSDAESSSSSSSSSSSDSDSHSIQGGAASSSGLSGSGDDYIDERQAAAVKAARVKVLKDGKRVRVRNKVLRTRGKRDAPSEKDKSKEKEKGKGKRKAEEGESVFE